MPYIPTTEAERAAMLQAIGVESVDELFSDIPEAIRFQGWLDLPEAMSEADLQRHLRRLASRNADLDRYICFLGAGAYDHLIPAALENLVARNEFVTAYTPYQAEISQGVLQTIYEFQSLICRLTGLDVANASMYDGASAVAEACIMAAAATDRPKVILSGSMHPEYIQVTQTYLSHQNVEVKTIPVTQGLTDMRLLEASVDEQTAAVVVQHPNAYGVFEKPERVAAIAKAKGALFISVVDPISLGILKSPGEYGADIAVGEGQPLGIPLSFGGPYLGFLAARKELVRRMPGRIVGRTVDAQGRPGYVLTLQTREQHIRRQRATSNICTNQALMALRATVYLSLLGRHGLRRVAELALQKARYAYERLCEIPGWTPPWREPFFKEFVLRAPVNVNELNRFLFERGIIGGFPLENWKGSLAGTVLFCVTEARTREEIDTLVDAVREFTTK